MFYGQIIKSKTETTLSQTPTNIVHISSIALTPQSQGRNNLYLKKDQARYLLASLEAGKINQLSVDLYVLQSENVSFYLEGKGEVHLTGYCEPGAEGTTTNQAPVTNAVEEEEEEMEVEVDSDGLDDLAELNDEELEQELEDLEEEIEEVNGTKTKQDKQLDDDDLEGLGDEDLDDLEGLDDDELENLDDEMIEDLDADDLEDLEDAKEEVKEEKKQIPNVKSQMNNKNKNRNQNKQGGNRNNNRDNNRDNKQNWKNKGGNKNFKNKNKGGNKNFKNKKIRKN